MPSNELLFKTAQRCYEHYCRTQSILQETPACYVIQDSDLILLSPEQTEIARLNLKTLCFTVV